MPAKRDSTKCLIRLLKPPAQVQLCDWTVAYYLHMEGLADSRLRARKVKSASDAARQETSRWMWHVVHRIGQLKWVYLGRPLIMVVTPKLRRGADGMNPVRVWHFTARYCDERNLRELSQICPGGQSIAERRTLLWQSLLCIVSVERRPWPLPPSTPLVRTIGTHCRDPSQRGLLALPSCRSRDIAHSVTSNHTRGTCQYIKKIP